MFRGCSGVFRGVPGAFRGCSGVFWGCSRGVPGLTDTRVLEFLIRVGFVILPKIRNSRENFTTFAAFTETKSYKISFYLKCYISEQYQLFYACSKVIFSLTPGFQSVFQRDLRFIQISDVTKKHSNVHSSLLDYWSCVTEHGCNENILSPSLVPRHSPPAHSTRLGAKCRDVTE